MEVKEFQDKIIEYASKWAKKRKISPDEQESFTHLIEEVGELARQYVNLRWRKEQYDEKDIEDAIADIAIELVMLAHLRGLNIEEVVLESIKEGEKLLEE